DTNVEENPLTMRAITSRLYGGDTHSRIQQEIVLGMAGYKLLKALGYSPSAYHMNEGHSAFLAIAQIKDLVANHGLSFEEALTGVQHSNLFTTHTPVPAGNDVFPREMIDQYFAQDARDIGIRMETLLNLGRVQENDPHEPFSMTVLALKCSKTANGVSKLHGHVSRKLWHRLWPGLPLDESPIKSITNGIHTATFTARDMADLYDRYLGPAWRNQTAAPETWDGVDMIPDEELWRIRCRNRSLLVTYCRDRLRDQLLRRGAGRMELEDAANELSPDALTIGFARRFATYKRATLLLHDIDRLAKILSNPERPVQFLFSGKAHPADNLGKELILRLVHARRRPELRGKIVFIEDYDMNVARRLVQGVDVWLNNPRRPLEACGTSGMKAAVNGALNMSVLDGWWYEAFDGSNGWSIGQGEEYDDSGYQDEVESRSIYDLLEREIIPTFYDRTPRGVPVDWVKLMKQSIRSIAPHFSAARMVGDYCRECYGPIAKDYRAVVAAQFRPVREARAKTEQFRKHWGELRILSVETQKAEQIPIGKSLPLKVVVHLGPFTPEEVAVQVRYGTLDVTNQIHGAHLYRMLRGQPGAEPGVYVFEGELASERAGTFGFSVRLIPVLHSAPHPAIPGLITWWE
ncbi:MAG TPA: alpha-glucan family phosphorylase, partial [Oligoflexia bacterium]|nr:alpha-glucan family phosphorylase [Oligoflexia bacterium]